MQPRDSSATDAPLLINGHRYWMVNGRLRPFVAGGADGDPDPTDLPTDPPPPADPPADPAPTDPPVDPPEGPDWKALARKHEKRAKENAEAAAELARIKAENQTPSEKALADARADERAKVVAEHAQSLAGARLEAALTGIVDDPAEFVEDLNLAKFVTDDGEVDTAAIAAVKEKYQKAATAKAGPGSADNGARARDDKPTRSSSIEAAVTKKLSGS